MDDLKLGTYEKEIRHDKGNRGDSRDPLACDTIGVHMHTREAVVKLVMGRGDKVFGTLTLAEPNMRELAHEILDGCDRALANAASVSSQLNMTRQRDS